MDTNQEAQEVNADAAASDVTEVSAQTASSEPTVEEYKSALEAERALREVAESDAMNAKKDIVAIKTGKKRSEIDATQASKVEVASKTGGIQQQAQPDLAAEIAEIKRQNAELLRGLSGRTMTSMPTGGGGHAESAAPKPKGHWSDAQKASLKARGWSDEKIAIAEQTARTNSGSGTKSAADYGISKRVY